MKLRRLAGALMVVGLVGCGQEPTVPEGPPPPAATSAVPSASTSSSATSSPVTSPPASVQAAAPQVTTGQPAVDGPRDGAPLLVVGVVPPDTLNVRAEAGADSDVVVELPVDAYGLSATGGSITRADGSTWVELRAGDQGGWANARFLAVTGSRSEVTFPMLDYADFLSGDAEAERSLPDEFIRWAGRQYPALDRVVHWNEPIAGNASADHLVVDLLRDGSGSEAGHRLDVYYLLSEDDGSYAVRDVTVTTLCRRAVDLAGACT